MISSKLNTQTGKYNQTKPSFCARFKVSEVLMLYCVAGNLTYPNILKNHSALSARVGNLEGLPRTYQPLKMKALPSFSMSKYIKLFAKQCSIPDKENP